MKTLLLMRHAKSDWRADSSTDHARPLNKRGRRAAKTVGRFLARERRPDLILTSSAIRALETAELAHQAGDWRCPTQVVDAFYEGSINDVLRQVRAVDSAHETVLLAGHEPVWSDLVSRLIGLANVRMVTAAVARVDFEDGWSSVSPGSGRLVWLVTPKLLQHFESQGLTPRGPRTRA